MIDIWMIKMFNRPNIALIGKAGNGKSSAANYLCLKYGYYKYSFASALKKEVMDQFDLTYNDVFVDKPPEVRKILQDYGTLKRENDALHWVKKCFKEINTEKKRLFNLYPIHIDPRSLKEKINIPVVIDDMRFINEAIYCKNRKFIIIRLIRLGEYEAAGINEKTAKHVSEIEQEQIDADYTFKSRNLYQLYDSIDKLMEEMQGGK